jgi:hypothetical protein
MTYKTERAAAPRRRLEIQSPTFPFGLDLPYIPKTKAIISSPKKKPTESMMLATL